MFWTKTFIPTLKETPQEAESASHQLMLRSGLVRMLMAGAYSYLPLGFMALKNIENIIRQEMNASGASELLLPALQPQELWVKSGRNKDIGDVMIRFTDRKGRNICLGPTHEEVITDLVRANITSYKQLPLVLYQIQTKFRDEIRPRFGIVRACEFIMKDAYSFDIDEEGLDKNYQAMRGAYQRIFKRCGLDVLTQEADSGVMGGKVSHEFMVPAESGEDVVSLCPNCKFTQIYDATLKKLCPKCGVELEKTSSLEIGHIFKLGIKYSAALGANFIDANGKSLPIIMGCYGIGVSRLIAAIIEQNHDSEGIIWPVEVSPCKAIILPLDVTDNEIMHKAMNIYQELKKNNIDVLLDDRDERAGIKFKDADLIGIPVSIPIGKKNLKEQKIEIKTRRQKKVELVDESEAINKIREITG